MLVSAELFNHLVCIPSGLCPDWADWDPNQPVENAREAMQQADDWLGVPQVRHMTDASHKMFYCFIKLRSVSVLPG